MKKNTLSLIATILISFVASAQYVSPGTGLTLTLDDIAAASPSTVSGEDGEYIISENITISEGDTLNIEGDLFIEIEEDVLITIQGIFNVDGGEEEGILFTAADIEAPFEGFRFEQGSEITLRGATFEYGGGLRVLTENFLVEWCVFLDIVGGRATTSSVIQLSRGVPIIRHNLIGHNYVSAISSGANIAVSPYIFDNMILDNNLGNTNQPQINLGVSLADTPTIIKDNLIIGNEDAPMVGGIALANFVAGDMNAEISGNIIAENRYGVTVLGKVDDVKIFNNIIEANNIQDEPMQGGSGISISNTTGNPVDIFGNEIRENLWGITVIDAFVNLGDDDENPGGNIFADNGNGGEIYALYNNSSNPIQAKHNCWIEGEESTYEDVEAVIFHAADDPTLGEVFFDPFLCGVLGVEDFSSEMFSFYPNPAADVIYFENKDFNFVAIFDLGGRLISEVQTITGTNQLELNLAKGIYILKFSNKKHTISKKLIVR